MQLSRPSNLKNENSEVCYRTKCHKSGKKYFHEIINLKQFVLLRLKTSKGFTFGVKPLLLRR